MLAAVNPAVSTI